jgi:subtilisin family serine protease
MNFRARSIQQSAQVGSSSDYDPYSAAGLLGDGQIVTIADTGVDYFSCYFYDSQGQIEPSDVSNPKYDLSYRKIIQYNYNSCGNMIDVPGGHGTHVCGIIAGGIADWDLFSDGKYGGVAPNAKISVSSFGTPDTGLCVPPVFQVYGPGYNAGSRIHSNSWGAYFTGDQYYSDQDTDRVLFLNPVRMHLISLSRNNNFFQELAVFFSAGNAGDNGEGAMTVTMESTSKNVIAVGSSETTLSSTNIDYVAFYSSKGPTYDNRIKPDLVSPGDGLLSANSQGNGDPTCSEIEMTGTSMASPSAAGAGALVRQYFADTDGQFWTAVCNPGHPSCKSFNPSGYLVKGILLHSGVSMALFNGGGNKDVELGPAPDTIQGFGRIGLMNVLPLKGVITGFELFVADAVEIRENMQIVGHVNVANSNFPLR